MSKLKMVSNVLQILVKLGSIMWPGIVEGVKLDLLALPPEFALVALIPVMARVSIASSTVMCFGLAVTMRGIPRCLMFIFLRH